MTVFQVDAAELPLGDAVWLCDGCGCVHVRARATLLTFTTKEFAAFMESANECFWRLALIAAAVDEGLGLGPPSHNPFG